MGVHRLRFDWWAATRRHLIWVAAATAVFTVTAAVSYAARNTNGVSQDNAQATQYPLYPTVPDMEAEAVFSFSASSRVGDLATVTGSPSAVVTTSAQDPTSPVTSENRDSAGRATPTPIPAPNPAEPSPSVVMTFVAVYAPGSSWSQGYVATVAITNGGPVAATWRLEIELPSGSSFTRWWNGSFDLDGTRVVVTPPSYASTLAAGAQTTIGYEVRRTGTRTTPQSCVINGSPCRYPTG